MANQTIRTKRHTAAFLVGLILLATAYYITFCKRQIGKEISESIGPISNGPKPNWVVATHRDSVASPGALNGDAKAGMPRRRSLPRRPDELEARTFPSLEKPEKLDTTTWGEIMASATNFLHNTLAPNELAGSRFFNAIPNNVGSTSNVSVILSPISKDGLEAINRFLDSIEATCMQSGLSSEDAVAVSNVFVDWVGPVSEYRLMEIDVSEDGQALNYHQRYIDGQESVRLTTEGGLIIEDAQTDIIGDMNEILSIRFGHLFTEVDATTTRK